MTGKIFISYRRGDDPGSAGRLFDALKAAFDSDELFLDVDNIEPGLDFADVIHERIAQSEVLLAVIGKHWCDARDKDGRRRLENSSDNVRIEIESALNQKKRVIPVLFGDTPMPTVSDLPESLSGLSRRNAVSIRHERFSDDTKHLTNSLRKVLHSATADKAAAGNTEEAGPVGLLSPTTSIPKKLSSIADRTSGRSRRMRLIQYLLLVALISGAFIWALMSRVTTQNQPRWCLDHVLQPDELRICGTPALLALDKQLNDAFDIAYAKTRSDKRKSLNDEEAVWVRDKRGACGSSETCIRAAYLDRIGYLKKLAND
jgi:uncharacterized protein YecT (DUF1311 family)